MSIAPNAKCQRVLVLPIWLVMAVLWNRQAIIFLPCGYFLSYYLSFFSSPNLSGRRLDVYHTSTHGVALVWIYNADLKCAARGSQEIQDAKNRHFGTIAPICRAISSALMHVLTIGKKLLNSNTWSTCPDKLCGVEQRAPIFDRAAITLGIGPHF